MSKITPRSEDYSEWYLDVIAAADLAEHGPTKGTMIIKPYGYAIWENIQKILDAKFKQHGVKNAYFPLLIPESLLNREKEHVEGFSPEIAVVTHAGGKKLDEPLVVRPTSETIIYETYSKWINSYRDLPLLINQWANIVRWEMRPRLFLRTTEFLWQEGHTVHSTETEADEFAKKMLVVYQEFVEEYLAMAVVPGPKSESERFAGAVTTYTIESMMQDGKALQMGTSHMLGQNFSKPFNIKFLDQNNQEQFGWQTSWGVSTRLIGGLIMSHSDDAGLVLPPSIAPIHIVVIPVFKTDEEKTATIAKAHEYKQKFLEAGWSVEVDERDERVGAKIFEWEKKGVPVRVEVGPKDLANKSVIAARRDTSEKRAIPEDQLVVELRALLGDIQTNLLARNKACLAERTVKADTWEEFTAALESGKFVLAYWDGTPETEANIKEQTKATIRVKPFAYEPETGKDILTGQPSERRVIFAKSY